MNISTELSVHQIIPCRLVGREIGDILQDFLAVRWHTETGHIVDEAGRSSKVQFRFRELGGNFGKGFRLPMAIEIFMGDIIAIELTDRLHHLTDGRILSKIACIGVNEPRSEEHTSELQSLMHISYPVFCLKKNK